MPVSSRDLQIPVEGGRSMAEARVALISRRQSLAEAVRVALSFAGLRFVAVQTLPALEAELLADDPATAVLIDLTSFGDEAADIVRAVRGTRAGGDAPLFFLGSGSEEVSSTATALTLGGDAYFSMPVEAARVIARLATYLSVPVARIPASLLLGVPPPEADELGDDSAFEEPTQDGPLDLSQGTREGEPAGWDVDDDDDELSPPEVTAEMDASTLRHLSKRAAAHDDDAPSDIASRVQRLRSRVAEARGGADDERDDDEGDEASLGSFDDERPERAPDQHAFDAITERITEDDLVEALARVEEREERVVYPPLEAMPSFADHEALVDEERPSTTSAGAWEPPPLDEGGADGGFLAPPPTLAEELAQAQEAAAAEAAAAEEAAAAAAAEEEEHEQALAALVDVPADVDERPNELYFPDSEAGLAPPLADLSFSGVDVDFSAPAAAFDAAAANAAPYDAPADHAAPDLAAAVDAAAYDADTNAAAYDASAYDDEDEAPPPPQLPEGLSDLDALALPDPDGEAAEQRRLLAEANFARELEERVQAAVTEAREEAAYERARLEADLAEASERERHEADQRLAALEARVKAEEAAERAEMRRLIEEARAEADARVRELEEKLRSEEERLRAELERKVADAESRARDEGAAETSRIAAEQAAREEAERQRKEAEARAEAEARVAAAEEGRGAAEDAARRELADLQRRATDERTALEERLAQEAAEKAEQADLIAALEQKAAETEAKLRQDLRAEVERREQLAVDQRREAEEQARLRAELEAELRREVAERVAAAEDERARALADLRQEADALVAKAAEDARREAEERLSREALKLAEQAADEARAEAEARGLTEAEAARRQAEERLRLAAEEARRLAEERLRAEAEEARQQAEERLRAEAAEALREAEEQARVAAEQARVAAEEARRAADEALREAQEQARLAAEEARREADEARREAEEALREAEEARRQAEERLRAEAEERSRLAAEQARRDAEEQARLAAETARRDAEEQARVAAETARREAEEQARLAAEDALRALEERLRAEAEERRRQDESRERALEQRVLIAEEAVRAAEERTARLLEEERRGREEAEAALKAREDDLVSHRKRWAFRQGSLLPGGSPGEGTATGESALGVGRISWWGAEDGGAPLDAVTFSPGGELPVEPPPPPERWIPLDPPEGAFADGELPALLWGAHVLGVTGAIVLEDEGGMQRTLHLEWGEPVGFVSDLGKDRPEEALLRAGLVTAKKHAELRAGPVRSARRTCAHLVDENALKPQELFTAIRGVLIEQVLSLFEMTSGRYRWVQDAAHAKDRVRLQHRFDAVLAEGVRRKYDLPRLWRVLGGAQTLLGKDDKAPRLPPLTPAEQSALSLLDGQRSLEDAVLDGGLTAEDVLRAGLIGVCCGAARVVARGLPTAPAEQEADAERALAIDKERILDRLHAARHGDYFLFLGIAPESTSFEVRRAAEHVRRQFDPRRYSDPAFRELTAALEEIRQVAEEAEAVLHDDALRAGYVRSVVSRRTLAPAGRAHS